MWIQEEAKIKLSIDYKYALKEESGQLKFEGPMKMV